MLSVAGQSAVGKAEKPQQIVRGQASRLPWAWNGLCFGVAFHEASSLGVRDIVNNVAPTTVTGLAWTTDALGNPSANLGLSSYLEYPDTPTHDRPSLELTAYVRVKWSGTPEDWGGLMCNVHSPGVSPFSTWSIYQQSNNVGKLGGMITNGTTDYFFGPTAVAMPTTQYVNIFLRWRSGEFTEIYVYGERADPVTVLSGALKSGALGYAASQGIRINATPLTTENFGAHYSQAMVWSRMLTDTEMKWVCADPFGWYSPRRESVALSAPFPVGPGMAAQPMTVAGSGRR